MLLYDVTLPDPAANLALDEALLETSDRAWSEGNSGMAESLRLWEPQTPMVVLGRSSPIEQEVNLDYCRRHRIPVLRRCSGGATIVTGPGCLMYAVVLEYANKPELRMLDQAHRFVMEKMRAAILQLGIDASIEGTSDLAIQGKKVSGNSLRCRRHGFLYHGTMICDFDRSLVANCLGSPVRQPSYRGGRDHDEFLTRLPCSTPELREAITDQWKAAGDNSAWPRDLTVHLTSKKYLSRSWIEAR